MAARTGPNGVAMVRTTDGRPILMKGPAATLPSPDNAMDDIGDAGTTAAPTVVPTDVAIGAPLPVPTGTGEPVVPTGIANASLKLLVLRAPVGEIGCGAPATEEAPVPGAPATKEPLCVPIERMVVPMCVILPILLLPGEVGMGIPLSVGAGTANEPPTILRIMQVPILSWIKTGAARRACASETIASFDASRAAHFRFKLANSSSKFCAWAVSWRAWLSSSRTCALLSKALCLASRSSCRARSRAPSASCARCPAAPASFLAASTCCSRDCLAEVTPAASFLWPVRSFAASARASAASRCAMATCSCAWAAAASSVRSMACNCWTFVPSARPSSATVLSLLCTEASSFSSKTARSCRCLSEAAKDPAWLKSLATWSSDISWVAWTAAIASAACSEAAQSSSSRAAMRARVSALGDTGLRKLDGNCSCKRKSSARSASFSPTMASTSPCTEAKLVEARAWASIVRSSSALSSSLSRSKASWLSLWEAAARSACSPMVCAIAEARRSSSNSR
mmetsp:Transcript_60117/g.152558  ORF Transcript_60117/g.152558 Transcript_60117/m.152558 type:complete len:511 (+) Transcript_60117:179-1711(+)